MNGHEGPNGYIIRDFEHIPGHHCGSTALRDVCHFYGHELSESMCFGLGNGIGFFYVNGDQIGLDISPSRLFGGRTPVLEADFFNNLGIPFDWHEDDDFPWPDMRQWIDRDVPVLLMCDLKYLGYYNTSTHFSGHVIVLAGYNEGEVLLADTHFETLQRASLDELSAAMVSQHFPLPVKNNWHEIDRFDLPDLEWAGRQAISQAASNMLEPQMPLGGISGIRSLADDIVNWGAAEDMTWCARFGYQVIEKRGTGGGNFRRLYAGFLEELSAHLPAVKELGGPARTWAIAEQWTQLASLLKQISETEDVSLLETAAELTGSIADEEESLFRDLRGAISDS